MIFFKRIHGFVPLLALLGLAAVACGGTGSNADRRKDAGTQGPPEFNDPGSLPNYSCEADKPSSGIITYILEDWETGAASRNFYTNNDRCEACQTAADIINGTIDAGVEVDRDTLDAGLAQRAACVPDCLASQVPSYFAKPVPADKIPGGRCGSQYAFHVRAGPLLRWGGQLGITFGSRPKCVTEDCPADSDPIPGGPYDGIAFWARVAPGSGTSMRVQVGESHTDVKYPEPGDAGPPCVQQRGSRKSQ